MDFGQNSRPDGHMGYFVKIDPKFFSFERIFRLFFGALYMISTSFGAKTTILCSSQNSRPVRQKGIFVQILPQFFFFFFPEIIFHLFLYPLNMLSTIFHAKTATLHSRQDVPRAIFIQNLSKFFSFRRILHLYFRPLNILSTCFGAKPQTWYSVQNSRAVRQKQQHCILVRILNLTDQGHFRTKFI